MASFLDAADLAAVRAFWVAALGYTHHRRAGVSDVHDPRWLNPVLVFAVPKELAQPRLATAVAAGGRLLDEHEGRRRVADPEGNEMVIVSGA